MIKIRIFKYIYILLYIYIFAMQLLGLAWQMPMEADIFQADFPQTIFASSSTYGAAIWQAIDSNHSHLIFTSIFKSGSWSAQTQLSSSQPAFNPIISPMYRDNSGAVELVYIGAIWYEIDAVTNNKVLWGAALQASASSSAWGTIHQISASNADITGNYFIEETFGNVVWSQYDAGGLAVFAAFFNNGTFAWDTQTRIGGPP